VPRRIAEMVSCLLSLLAGGQLIRVAYKNKGSLKQDDLRRRREEQQVEIRRQKREENISKRRNFLPPVGPDSDDEGTVYWDPGVCHRLSSFSHPNVSPS
jgi:hypothetical protein